MDYFKKINSKKINTEDINNEKNIYNPKVNSYNIIFYMTLLFVFAAIFFLAYINLNKKINLFGIHGLPAEFEDWMIMILSIGSIIKIVYELSVIDTKYI